MEEGREEGKEEGKEEGREKGREEGREEGKEEEREEGREEGKERGREREKKKGKKEGALARIRSRRFLSVSFVLCRILIQASQRRILTKTDTISTIPGPVVTAARLNAATELGADEKR